MGQRLKAVKGSDIVSSADLDFHTKTKKEITHRNMDSRRDCVDPDKIRISVVELRFTTLRTEKINLQISRHAMVQ